MSCRESMQIQRKIKIFARHKIKAQVHFGPVVFSFFSRVRIRKKKNDGKEIVYAESELEAW